jgi:UDP-N-acetylmuramate--alanine ligase
MDEFASCFNDADIVYVTPVFAAGEAPMEGVDAAALVSNLKQRGHHSAAVVQDAADLARVLAAQARPDDMVVCLGAGDITKWAAGLADAMQKARG